MSTLSVGTVRSNSSSPPTIQNTSGTEIGTFCRAWVNFNGTGVVAIRSSFGVSSIFDNAAGNYTVNFSASNVMPDANYVTVLSAGRATATAVAPGGDRNVISVLRQQTSDVIVLTAINSGTADTTVNGVDKDQVFVAVFR